MSNLEFKTVTICNLCDTTIRTKSIEENAFTEYLADGYKTSTLDDNTVVIDVTCRQCVLDSMV